MQIGCCWFDAEKHQLLNQSLSSRWQMAIYESAVLMQLVKHRGQVVSNQSLVQVLETSNALDTRLHDIVYKIHRFLGRESAPLLEKVADQGYILHVKPTAPSLSLWRQPKRMISIWRYILLTLMTLGLVSFMYTQVGHADFFQTHFQQVLVTEQGKRISFHWYDDAQRRLIYQSEVGELTQALKTCSVVPWSSMFLSTSQDKQIVNLLLKRGLGESIETKSVKVIVDSNDLSFINSAWLRRVGICG